MLACDGNVSDRPLVKELDRPLSTAGLWHLEPQLCEAPGDDDRPQKPNFASDLPLLSNSHSPVTASAIPVNANGNPQANAYE